MRVAVVAEYYPRAADPVLGVWAHRQALAARDAGAEVRVLVLHRPVPSRAALRARDRGAARAAAPAAARRELDGIAVTYVPVRRPAAAAHLRALGRVGGADARARAAARRRRSTSSTPTTPRPPGDAVRRARPGVPLVVSRPRRRRARGRAAAPAAAATVRRALGARAARARQLGRHRARAPARSARRNTRVVHLGTDVPPDAAPRAGAADARHRRPPGRAQAPRRRRCARCGCCATSTPTLRWVVVGDGPERPALERWRGARARRARRLPRRSCRPPRRARPRSRRPCSCCRASTRRSASPTSRRWPAACPAIGCRGEAGPEEIARQRRRDPARRARRPGGLAAELRALLDDAAWRRELGDAAPRDRRARASRGRRAGAATVAAYEEALR